MLNIAKVKELRGTHSQAECAKRGELPGGYQAWSNIENAKGKENENIRLKTLLALARGLQCSISDIVDEPHPPKRRKARS